MSMDEKIDSVFEQVAAANPALKLEAFGFYKNHTEKVAAHFENFQNIYAKDFSELVRKISEIKVKTKKDELIEELAAIKAREAEIQKAISQNENL